jgi:hypothetical protein
LGVCLSIAGAIIFVTEAYCGRSTDEDIVAHSKLLERIDANTTVIADNAS